MNDRSPIETSLRFKLRNETRNAHDELDGILVRRGVFSSSNAYVNYLALQLGEFLRYETMAEAHMESAVADWWPGAVRSELIRNDLGQIGEPDWTTPPETTPPELPSLTPGPVGFPEFVGRSYVMEGSQLGGAVILKHVGNLGVTSERSGTFLAYAARNRGAWPRFCRWLDGISISRAQEARIVRSALETFDRYKQVFGAR